MEPNNIDKHKSRSISNQNNINDAETILNQPYTPNYTFKNYGLFTQLEKFNNNNVGYFAGIRGDIVETRNHKTQTQDTKYAISGFTRIEKYFNDYTLYAGGICRESA